MFSPRAPSATVRRNRCSDPISRTSTPDAIQLLGMFKSPLRHQIGHPRRGLEHRRRGWAPPVGGESASSFGHFGEDDRVRLTVPGRGESDGWAGPRDGAPEHGEFEAVVAEDDCRGDF